jgi:hypothetical protein
MIGNIPEQEEGCVCVGDCREGCVLPEMSNKY